MRLSHHDWNQVSNFLQELYAQTEPEAFRRTVLTGLARLIDCQHASFNEIDSRTNSLVIDMQPWVPEMLALAPRLEAHFDEHPQLAHYRQSDDRQVYQTTDFFSLREFRQKGIYQEFYRHLDTEHQLTCVLSELGAATDVGIAVNRHLKDFSERDKALLNHLRPHLIRARSNAMAIATAESRWQSLAGALDTVSAGLALVDAAGRMTWATPRVPGWLELYFPRSPQSPGRLPDALARWLRAQLEALKHGAAPGQPPVGFVAHHQRSTLTVLFHAVPDGTARLVFSEKCEWVAADRARELGLTAREAEVLHWINEGKSNPEIALLLHISTRTVHKHVEHILAKLGVETRAAAARQVTAG